MNELLLRRRLFDKIEDPHEYVDMGLPSGKLWSTMNLGATTIEGVGLYYSWANIEGHGGGYDFSSATYANTVGASIMENIPLANDAANVAWGGKWRIPSYSEWVELINNSTVASATINNRNGVVLTSKNNGETLFLPSGGYRAGKSIYSNNGQGNFISSTYVNSSFFKIIVKPNNKATFYTNLNGNRYQGMNIRPIRNT